MRIVPAMLNQRRSPKLPVGTGPHVPSTLLSPMNHVLRREHWIFATSKTTSRPLDELGRYSCGTPGNISRCTAPEDEGCSSTYLFGDGAREDIGARMKGRDLARMSELDQAKRKASYRP
jgi:hypothetical protein